MLGAMIGDIAGSRFEFVNHKGRDFDIFDSRCFFTDDTVMTAAVAYALSNDIPFDKAMRIFGKEYPGRGYGGMFASWLSGRLSGPYNSFGNGSAMRVSPCAWAAKSEREAAELAKASAEITHNHPEGIKGAVSVSVCIYKALIGASKDEIREYAETQYPSITDMDLNCLMRTYSFNETCQNTVPQAIFCFLEGKDFIDCLRTAIGIGGDTDTLAAITCSIAEAFYGIPDWMVEKASSYLKGDDKGLIINAFNSFMRKFNSIENYIPS